MMENKLVCPSGFLPLHLTYTKVAQTESFSPPTSRQWQLTAVVCMAAPSHFPTKQRFSHLYVVSSPLLPSLFPSNIIHQCDYYQSSLAFCDLYRTFCCSLHLIATFTTTTHYFHSCSESNQLPTAHIFIPSHKSIQHVREPALWPEPVSCIKHARRPAVRTDALQWEPQR